MTAKAEVVHVDGDKARSAKTIERLAELWNHHYGESLEASTRLFTWTLAPRAERTVALFAGKGRQIQDFIIVSHVQGAVTGTIDALLLPAQGNIDVDNDLLHAAEEWLRGQGAGAVKVGGGPWSLLRGSALLDAPGALPDDEDIYRLYQERVQDMALDVSRYVPPTDIEAVGGVVHPAQPRDRDNVMEFLRDPSLVRIAATNNSASAEHVAYLHELIAAGTRVSDLMLLWTENGLGGICQIIFSDSATPLELVYPYTLMRPWAALGVLAVRDSLPDGAVQWLLDAALRRLHNNGINSCVATGVVSSSSYERMGFKNFLNWNLVTKNL